MVMKSGVSRGLEGIDDDTRAAAQEAARQAGMTLGQWIEQAIADRAAEEGLRRDAEDDTTREDRDVDAVAESIARLTRRIHSMAPGARSAVTGLSARLDEIEAQLGRAQTVDAPGERRSRSLKGVTDMVDRLAREIEGADGTARP
jgi:localization factor PodJL